MIKKERSEKENAGKRSVEGDVNSTNQMCISKEGNPRRGTCDRIIYKEVFGKGSIAVTGRSEVSVTPLRQETNAKKRTKKLGGSSYFKRKNQGEKGEGKGMRKPRE